MIYFHKNTQNTIKTDSWTKFIPPTIEIFLDDERIAIVDNISTDVRFYEFVLESAYIQFLQIREYTLRLYSSSALLKAELAQVVDSTKDPVNTQLENNITYKIYE